MFDIKEQNDFKKREGSMSQKLQDAIAAARAGETENAQRLLADILQENPNEVHAWFLLSHLVESETKQKAYLQKVVTLDPSHNKARQRLAQLQAAGQAAPAAAVDTVVSTLQAELEPEPLPISTDPFDFEAQAAGDTIPEWMAGDGAAARPATAVATTPDSTAEPLDIPDWLQVSLDEEEEPEKETAAVVEEVDAITTARRAAKDPVPVTPRPGPSAKEIELARLNRMLALLVALTILILLIMGYLIFFL
jgi:hypothetical protein